MHDMNREPAQLLVASFFFVSLRGLSYLTSSPPLAATNRRWLADNFGVINSNVPRLLNLVNFAHSIVGPYPLQWTSSFLNSITGHIVPVWNPYMPKGAAPLKGECVPEGSCVRDRLLCVCVRERFFCVCEREREREREGQGMAVGENKTTCSLPNLCVCVCAMCVCV